MGGVNGTGRGYGGCTFRQGGWPAHPLTLSTKLRSSKEAVVAVVVACDACLRKVMPISSSTRRRRSSGATSLGGWVGWLGVGIV